MQQQEQQKQQLAPEDLANALKVAGAIHRFRDRGHLVARLDPLRRCAGGPWVGPIGEENARCDAALLALVARWPEGGTEAERAAFAARELGLEGAGAAERELPVGALMPGESVGPRGLRGRGG